MLRRFALAGTVAALAATVLLAGGALRASTEPAAAVATSTETAERLEAGFAAGDTESLIRSLERKVRRDSRDAKSHLRLGLAYQQQTRETADPSYYPLSERALRRALALEPKNASTVSALGSLALARHQFADALVFGRRAQRLAPYSALHYGVMGDALLELGRYEEAFRAFDRMAALRPSLSSYARISYARELLGRPRAAESAMRLALDAAGGQPEPTAWTRSHLGKLVLSQGRLDAAERHYRAALAASPGYGAALEGLAHVEAARGRIPRAIRLAKQAEAAETLGDLYRLTGKHRLARRAYAEAFAGLQAEIPYGVRMSLDLASFQVDRGIRLREALALARRGYRERPSIVGDDALGWALVRNGRCQEGLVYARRALRLGPRDANAVFHRGMAERCVGNHAAAKRWFRLSLEINPHFSLLWSGVARQHAA
jgi:tetratricopeptide (TPR) repeat protein